MSNECEAQMANVTPDNPTLKVVTLQAEVRVIKMDARQVTKGIFAQIDEVQGLDDLDVMGRVCVPPKSLKEPHFTYWLIGRSTMDGTLVKLEITNKLNGPFRTDDNEIPKWSSDDSESMKVNKEWHTKRAEAIRAHYQIGANLFEQCMEEPLIVYLDRRCDEEHLRHECRHNRLNAPSGADDRGIPH